MNSHEDKLKDYLKEVGTATSDQLRGVFKWADVRKPVSSLRKAGYISTKYKYVHGRRLAIYTFIDKSLPPRVGHWCYKGDNADYKMIEQKDCECNKPEQYTIGY